MRESDEQRIERIEKAPWGGWVTPEWGEDVKWLISQLRAKNYPETLETQCLLVEITEEEYAAIKRACIEAAK